MTECIIASKLTGWCTVKCWKTAIIQGDYHNLSLGDIGLLCHTDLSLFCCCVACSLMSLSSPPTLNVFQRSWLEGKHPKTLTVKQLWITDGQAEQIIAITESRGTQPNEITSKIYNTKWCWVAQMTKLSPTAPTLEAGAGRLAVSSLALSIVKSI